MRVRELVEWLQAFEDQEAVVCVVVSEPGTGYYDQGGTSHVEKFSPDTHAEYTDWRESSFVRENEPHYLTRELLLGLNDA